MMKGGLAFMRNQKNFNNKHIHYCNKPIHHCDNNSECKINDFRLSVLSWNIYLGADLTPLAGGITPAAVSLVFRQFLATNFPDRAKALARQIASSKPDLIGLQEAERWELKIPDFPIVIYDFVELLLYELKESGLHYEIAARNNNQYVTDIPDNNGNKISFLDRDVILIRKNHSLKVINKQEFNFTAAFNEFIRGWSAIDVKFDDRVIRMINTHLDPLDPVTRAAQAMELMNGPANSNLPLIITGDLNSPPDTKTYNIFTSKSGFLDVWSEIGKGPGFTCCQAPDLLNSVSRLNQRIDYILFKNGWKPIEAVRIGETQGDRTKTGLWPTDHAGVLSKLELTDHHYDQHFSFTALGDSIAYGVGATNDYGYVNYLRDFLETKKGRVNPVNRAVPGFASSDLLRQLENDAVTQNAVKNADLITISIGGSTFQNCMNEANPHDCLSDGVGNFANDWLIILNMIRNFIKSDAQILVMTVCNPLTGNDPNYKQLEFFIQQINNIIRNRKYRLIYGYNVVDVHTDFCGKFSDGRWKVCVWTHFCETSPNPYPTNRGHREIASLHRLVFLKSENE